MRAISKLANDLISAIEWDIERRSNAVSLAATGAAVLALSSMIWLKQSIIMKFMKIESFCIP